MKQLTALILTTLGFLCTKGCASGSSTSVNTSLMGAFELHTESVQGFHFEWRLRCFTMQHCDLSHNALAPHGGGIVNNSHSVRPRTATNIKAAQRALQFAASRHLQHTPHVQHALIKQALQASFQKQQELYECWELEVTNGSALACTFTADKNAQSTLHLFQKLDSPCQDGDGFCEYLIIPLRRTR